MSIKNKLLIGATALGLGTAANAQTEEHFSCGHDHTKNSPTEQSIQPRDGNYMWNDCDTIRTALISILPTPRADNRDMYYEGLQSIVDQTDVVAIKNVAHVKMNWAEMSSWLQENQNTEKVHGIFASLSYDQMPPALADTLQNIIAVHGPDIIYLEVPSQYPGKNYAVGGPGRGMVLIKSYDSNNGGTSITYEVAILHEGAHELGVFMHVDTVNNPMNSEINGNTSTTYLPEHAEIINNDHKRQVIDTNPDRNCEAVGVEDIQLDEASVVLYPNPAQGDHFTLESVVAPISSVKVFNSIGQLYTYTPRDAQEAHLFDMPLDDLTTGIWFITVVTEQGNITKKLVVVK